MIEANRLVGWLLLAFITGTCMVLTIFFLVRWYAAWLTAVEAATVVEERGMTEEELMRLEEGKAGAGDDAECPVCLEEMTEGQTTRVLPDCRHTFHRSCADAWLKVHPVCPICRARLLPPPSQPQPNL